MLTDTILLYFIQENVLVNVEIVEIENVSIVHSFFHVNYFS